MTKIEMTQEEIECLAALIYIKIVEPSKSPLNKLIVELEGVLNLASDERGDLARKYMHEPWLQSEDVARIAGISRDGHIT